MKRLFLMALLCLGVAQLSYAQIQKVMHQTYLLPNSSNVLELDIDAPEISVHYTEDRWMTVETHVAFYHNNTSILNFLEKNGRYHLRLKHNDSKTLSFLSNRKNLPEIKMKGKPIKEEIEYVIFVPKRIKKVYLGCEQLLAIEE